MRDPPYRKGCKINRLVREPLPDGFRAPLMSAAALLISARQLSALSGRKMWHRGVAAFSKRCEFPSARPPCATTRYAGRATPVSAAINSLRPGVLMMCAIAFTARLCDALFIQELVKKKKKNPRRCAPGAVKLFTPGLRGQSRVAFELLGAPYVLVVL